MASTRQLKGRIRSVKNTKQITKAMQMVAASKMRRAQESTKSSSPYTHTANEILASLANQGVTSEHPLFQVREVKKRLLIVVTSDKGLAGAYNSNVLKMFVRELKADDKAGIETTTVAVGRKIAQFASRLKDTAVGGIYENLPDQPTGSELASIIDSAVDVFELGEVDAVDMIYTEFVSSMTQVPVVKRLLPAGHTEAEISDNVLEAKYEPSAAAVLEGIVRRLVEAQLYQALLDARASEHSMRMLAMKNATDNASDLAEDLTLAMNKARQAAITQELAEISGGTEAMN